MAAAGVHRTEPAGTVELAKTQDCQSEEVTGCRKTVVAACYRLEKTEAPP